MIEDFGGLFKLLNIPLMCVTTILVAFVANIDTARPAIRAFCALYIAVHAAVFLSFLAFHLAEWGGDDPHLVTPTDRNPAIFALVWIAGAAAAILFIQNQEKRGEFLRGFFVLYLIYTSVFLVFVIR